MKNQLGFANIRQKICENYSKIIECNVINIGILTHVYDYSSDAELYAIFSHNCDYTSSFSHLLDMIEQLFPGYQVDVYSENYADSFNQSIIDGIIFI